MSGPSVNTINARLRVRTGRFSSTIIAQQPRDRRAPPPIKTKYRTSARTDTGGLDTDVRVGPPAARPVGRQPISSTRLRGRRRPAPRN